MVGLIILVVLLIYILAALVSRFAGRPLLMEAQSHEDALTRIIQGDEEFCLILRAFGRDGQTRLSDGYRPWYVPRSVGPYRYLEDVITQAAADACGLRTYELTDNRERYAPNGPVCIRVSNEHWQSCMGVLFDSAHTIVIVVPIIQDFNEGFKWEVQQLSLRNLRSRVILVIPPVPRFSPWHRWGILKASQIIQALEEFAGDIDDIDGQAVLHWDQELNKQFTLAVRIIADGSRPTSPMRVHYWYVDRKRNSSGPVGAKFYESFLVPAVRAIDSSLKELPFDRRYPYRRRARR